ncbi:unnamed protein product [Polarella glacialis]|uniref:Uncharacterized protein n=1 Tax=Polarella glacialis TaxID=89957 RepID=A0A813HVS6_POLGL|nr:unnamed protein product [Polarella glacialis]
MHKEQLRLAKEQVAESTSPAPAGRLRPNELEDVENSTVETLADVSLASQRMRAPVMTPKAKAMSIRRDVVRRLSAAAIPEAGLLKIAEPVTFIAATAPDSVEEGLADETEETGLSQEARAVLPPIWEPTTPCVSSGNLLSGVEGYA